MNKSEPSLMREPEVPIKKQGPSHRKSLDLRSFHEVPNLTEEEKLQLRIKELEHRNQYLEAENGLLKKLKEIERGMGLRD